MPVTHEVEGSSPFVPAEKIMGYVTIQEDTAGNKYFSEFDNKSTGSIRNWCTDKYGNILWETTPIGIIKRDRIIDEQICRD